jgi:hypothetical protein
MRRRFVVLVLLAGLASGCSDEINNYTTVAPTPVPPPTPDRIEYRVIGTFDRVTVRHSNVQDGTTQVVTGLPYVTSFTTLAETMFVSLEATARGEGYLQVQILVNGNVVREANSVSEDPRLQLSITYRRGQ